MDSSKGERATDEHRKPPLAAPAAAAGADEVNEEYLARFGNKAPTERQKSISSSSSSSDDSSSDEDFFQLDATNFSNPKITGNTLQNGESANVNPSAKNNSGNLFDQDELPLSSRPFSPDLSGAGPATADTTFGAAQTPPAQVMSRWDVPDPNRIPSSVFTRTKSTTPMDWSVASNESLFSIHPGNSSFSRDHVFLLGRSGELTNYNFSNSSLPPLPPISPHGGGSPATLDAAGKTAGKGLSHPGTAEEANAEAMKDVLRAAAEEHADKGTKQPAGGAPLSTSISRHSDGSATSFRSFAFPILTEGRSGSIKVEPEHRPKPAETPKADPNAAQTTWFSCFNSCPSCC